MKLATLGSAGYLPSFGRQTMSFLVVDGETRLLLDAGTGLGRILEPAIAALLPPGERLDILLTHYHLDHVVGLSYLAGMSKERPLRIFAPKAPLVAAGPEAIDRLLSPPLFPVTMDRWSMPIEVVPYSATELAIGSLELRLRSQRHPGGSVGVRIGDRLAYVTDTVMDPATVAFVSGVELLLHEVWLSEEEAIVEEAAKTGHSDAGAVADLAREAGVGRLWVVHHHPRRSPADVLAMAERMAERAGIPVEVPVEGTVVELS
jgi:ribonuclease BN (tRNA processing enzyme)